MKTEQGLDEEPPGTERHNLDTPGAGAPGRAGKSSLEMRKSEPEWSVGCFTMPTEIIKMLRETSLAGTIIKFVSFKTKYVARRSPYMYDMEEFF